MLLWGRVQSSLASRRSGGSGTLLLAQLLFKLGEFVHRDLLLLIHHLLNSLHFLDLSRHTPLATYPNKQPRGENKRRETYVVHKHRLNAVLQSDSARVAGPASAAQLQHHNTVLEAPKLNVASIFLDCRPDSCLQELLDHADNFVIFFIVAERFLLAALLRVLSGFSDRVDDRLAGGYSLRNQVEDFGFDMGPVCIACLGHSDELRSEEDGGDTVNIEQVRSQGGRVRRSESRARGQVLEE